MYAIGRGLAFSEDTIFNVSYEVLYSDLSRSLSLLPFLITQSQATANSERGVSENKKQARKGQAKAEHFVFASAHSQSPIERATHRNNDRVRQLSLWR